MKMVMKLMLFGMLGLVSFTGALAAALALTGNFSRATLDKLMGKEVDVAAEVEAFDELGPLARELNERSEALDQQKAALAVQEQRMKYQEEALQQERQQIDTLIQQLNDDLDEKAALRVQRLSAIATRVGAMKPKQAARALESLPEDEAAEILRDASIAKNAGKIMSEIEPAILGRIMQHMRDAE